MKFKDLLVAGTALIVVYNAGMVAGRMDCFQKFMDKYGDDILEKRGEITGKLSKRFTIKVTKVNK